MNIPIIRPRRDETGPSRYLKLAVREFLHAPVRLRMHLNPTYPWLNKGAVDWLNRHLKPGMRGFEWGSGRSTLYFADRIAELVSLEHKKKWYRRVQKQLAQRGHTGITHLLLEPDTRGEAYTRPALWAVINDTPLKPEYSAYFDHILSYPDHSFDFLLVDGRARVECVLNGRDKVKPGGFIVLDNSEWPKYTPIFEVLRNWKETSYENGVWRTTIFEHPES